MTHTIDILLASYQGEKFIEEQIQSILNQSYTDFHLWIRDDCSTDRTPLILQQLATKHPEKITIIPSTQNLGVRGNFSELMNHGKAPYVMFSDQDDYWLPNKIELTLTRMQELEKTYEKSSPLLVHTDLKVVKSNLSEISPSFWKYVHINPKADTLNRLLTQFVVTGCTMMLNRPLANLAKPIPQDCYMHDWWIALVAASFGHIGYCSEPTILYRQHTTNDTGAKKYRIKRILDTLFSKTKSNHQRTIKQAQVFLERYGSQLDPKKRKLIELYSTLSKRSYISRKIITLKNRIFKTGFLRNLYHFLIG